MSRENHRTATRAQIKRSKTLGDNTSVRSKTGIYEAQKLRSGLHNRVGYDVRDVDVKTIRLCVHDNRRFPGNRGNRVYHQFITEFVCFKSMTEIAGNKKKKKANGVSRNTICDVHRCTLRSISFWIVPFNKTRTPSEYQ